MGFYCGSVCLWYIQCFMTDSGRRDHRDHILNYCLLSPLGNFVYAYIKNGHHQDICLVIISPMNQIDY